jgi:hypothetical protein
LKRLLDRKGVKYSTLAHLVYIQEEDIARTVIVRLVHA